jgi:hypothetical protein
MTPVGDAAKAQKHPCRSGEYYRSEFGAVKRITAPVMYLFEYRISTAGPPLHWMAQSETLRPWPQLGFVRKGQNTAMATLVGSNNAAKGDI